MQAVILICDGCYKELGSNGEYRSAMEARAAAYGRGWRFPPTVRANGTEGGRVSDACPDCIGNWTPKPAHSSQIPAGKQYRSIAEL